MPVAVEQHLPLAYSLACKVRGYLPLEDAKQSAVLGLLRACGSNSYAPDKGEFSTFAGTAIWREVHRERELRQPRWLLFSEFARPDPETGELTDPSDHVPDHRERDPAERAALREQVEVLLSRLPVNEQTAIVLRFGLDAGRARTAAEVGKEMGISRQRVHQLLLRAFQRLRSTAK